MPKLPILRPDPDYKAPLPPLVPSYDPAMLPGGPGQEPAVAPGVVPQWVTGWALPGMQRVEEARLESARRWPQAGIDREVMPFITPQGPSFIPPEPIPETAPKGFDLLQWLAEQRQAQPEVYSGEQAAWDFARMMPEVIQQGPSLLEPMPQNVPLTPSWLQALSSKMVAEQVASPFNILPELMPPAARVPRLLEGVLPAIGGATEAWAKAAPRVARGVAEAVVPAGRRLLTEEAGAIGRGAGDIPIEPRPPAVEPTMEGYRLTPRGLELAQQDPMTMDRATFEQWLELNWGGGEVPVEARRRYMDVVGWMREFQRGVIQRGIAPEDANKTLVGATVACCACPWLRVGDRRRYSPAYSRGILFARYRCL